MKVYIWCDGAAMPNGGPAGAGYVVVGGVHLLGSEALGDATNNVAEYTAVRNALRAAADAGATSAHVRMDSPVVFGHLSGASRARAEHLIRLKEEVEAQVARYPGRVTFARIPRERNGVADELAKDGARASQALSGNRRRSEDRAKRFAWDDEDIQYGYMGPRFGTEGVSRSGSDAAFHRDMMSEDEEEALVKKHNAALDARTGSGDDG